MTSLASRVSAEVSGSLATASFDFGGTHRHAGTVQPEVHRGRRRRRGLLGDGALVGGDLASERLGTALELPRLDTYAVLRRGRVVQCETPAVIPCALANR